MGFSRSRRFLGRLPKALETLHDCQAPERCERAVAQGKRQSTHHPATKKHSQDGPALQCRLVAETDPIPFIVLAVVAVVFTIWS